MNERVLELLKQMSTEEKLQCVHGQLGDPYRANQVGFIRGIDRLKIPNLFLADGEQGVNVIWETTAFPSKVSLASTFDINEAYNFGDAIGKEAKDSGIHLLLTPRVNIARDFISIKGTSNGGNYQTYSEDPILNGKMGVQESKGIQSKNQAMANLKQMFGSSTGAAQGAGNSIIDKQTLHELYMRPFEMVLKSGVASAMTSYNQVNGVWTYDYKEILNDYARDKWGFKGFVFNDWYCLYDPNSIRHGVTIEMPGADYYDEGNKYSVYGDELLKAIKSDNEPVSMEDLDKAVYYYLDTLDRFGVLDEEQRVPRKLSLEVKEKSISVARNIAAKGAVLLKNENKLLPIDFKDKNIAVIGPTGYHQAMPTFKESPYGFSDRKTGVFQLLKEKYGDKVKFAVGNDLDGEIIDSKYLKIEKDSTQNGLKRYVSDFIYETLSNGDLENVKIMEDYAIDKIVDHNGDNSLPFIEEGAQKGFFKEMPRKYYMWHGYICPDETGEYRISLQSKFPNLDDFDNNNVQNNDLAISTSGNLYIRESHNSEKLTRIGIGTRPSTNGSVDPYSEIVPCKDGWNNAGGTVYLEEGKEYEIYFNHTCLYRNDLEIRLAWTKPSQTERVTKAAVELAKKSDVVLLFGWHQSVNDSMSLQENQNHLIEEISSVNENTIVILNNGDPILMPWLNKVNSVLEMWFSGQEGARATLDILEGKVNPAGRLPVTFPKKLEDIASRSPKHPERHAPSGRISEKTPDHKNVANFTEGILNGYKWFDDQDIDPLFPFGYGLSYTSFEYSDLKVKQESGNVKVELSIRNTGEFDGDEVIQCYLGKPQNIPNGIQAAKKSLVDFKRIHIKSGETKQVELLIDNLYLRYFNPSTEQYDLFVGEREVLVGASSRDIKVKERIEIKEVII